MSSSFSSVSEASNTVNDSSDASDTSSATAILSKRTKHIKHVAQSATGPDILLFLIAFRILNALSVRTFFQPDEYFQSLEPAWELAFGEGSGAWITWEWKNHLRSAIHPAIFAVVYRGIHGLAEVLQLPSSTRADLLLAGPKTLQALFAAVGDYYTWKLGERIYGRGSGAAWAALFLTVASPWQFFCSTRTLSNCLETTLTIVALYNWPWHWPLSSDDGQNQKSDVKGLRILVAENDNQGSVDETTRLRRSLLLAALASILRPTNLFIWISLTLMTFARSRRLPRVVGIPRMEPATQARLVRFSTWSIAPNARECLSFLREGTLSGVTILVLSTLVDRVFYGVWVFPPVKFLYFNVVQSLAVFYGNNDWHYYLSQGYPLLLTTALPFALIGIYTALFRDSISPLTASSKDTLRTLAILSLIVPATLSVISHKEVRFMYPVLPALHILAAGPLSTFFGPAVLHEATHPKLAPPYRLTKQFTLLILLLINATIAIYTTTIHASGVIAVTHYLRNEFATYYAPSTHSTHVGSHSPINMTIGFLMPCHSTPWRSHLQNPPSLTQPGISAWALTCEPPVNLSPGERAIYLDEADLFYADPSQWLRRNMMRGPPTPRKSGSQSQFRATHERSQTYKNSRKREWPDYFVFFAQLEGVLRTNLRGSGYGECDGGRIWNTAWHDDWRRRGDVVVWCLERERQVKHEAKVKTDEGGARKQDEAAMGWLKGVAGMQRAERSMVIGDSGYPGKILGGGSVGDVNRKENSKTQNAGSLTGIVDRVVEKPFWKQRPLEPKKAEAKSWWHSIPGWPSERKKSVWERFQQVLRL